MNEQEKKRQRIYDMLHAETKPNFFFFFSIIGVSTVYKENLFVFFLLKWTRYKEMGIGGLNKKTKKMLSNCSRCDDLEGPHKVNKKACKWIKRQRENYADND